MDEDKKDAPFQPPSSIKIMHQRLAGYSSHYATGAIMSGPSGQGTVQLVFFEDAIQIQTETGELDSENSLQSTYKVSLQPNDLLNYREDKVRITMPIQAALELSELLSSQLRAMISGVEGANG